MNSRGTTTWHQLLIWNSYQLSRTFSTWNKCKRNCDKVFRFFFNFLVRLRAQFWLVLREVSIVLFGLLGIFCDLWLVKKISRHFINQSDLMRKTTMRAFSPLNASFMFPLELCSLHLNGCLHILVFRQYYNCSVVLEELLMFCFILQWSSESKETIWDWFGQAGVCSVTGNKLHCVNCKWNSYRLIP